MGTSATIIVEGVNYCKLYKHWDGGVTFTLKWLEDFNKKFTEIRGEDCSYKMAQLIRSSAFDCKKYHLDPSKTTGWGVIRIDDYNGNYIYNLKIDGTVTVKKGY